MTHNVENGAPCRECLCPPGSLGGWGVCECECHRETAENEARVATVKAWSADQHDAPRGFTRGTDENFNTLRIGRLVLAWGWES